MNARPLSRFALTLFLAAALWLPVPARAQTEMLQAPDPLALPGVTPLSEQEQDIAPLIAPPAEPAAPVIAPPPVVAPALPSEEEDRAAAVARVLQGLSERDKTLIIDETVRVNSNCQSRGLYAMFYDCNCLAGRFFEERVLYPEQSGDLLVGKIQNECVSDAGVAGYSYEQCVGSMNYIISRETLGDYCTCYANKMADLYTNNPNSNYDWIRYLGEQAMQVCIGVAQPSGR